MKLLFCLMCDDARKLLVGKPVKCACAKSRGAFDADGKHAWVRGPCVVIGMDASTIKRALVKRRGVGMWWMRLAGDRVRRED